MRIEQSPTVYLQKECPLCHCKDLHPIKTEQNTFSSDVRKEVFNFHKTWIQLMECSECGFCFTKEIPTDRNFFPARYDIEFNPSAEVDNNFKKDVLDQIFELFRKFGRVNGDLLDIGSFAGIFMRAANKRGFCASGVEVNPTMANYTKDALNLNVYNGTFLNFPCEKESFDVITLIDVLEHLLCPREMLEKCFEVLKPGGHILIKVPNCHPQIFKQNIANRLQINNEGTFSTFGHINHFSQESLSYVLKTLGFTPLECIVAESENWSQTSLNSSLKNIFRKCIFHALEAVRRITGVNWGLNISIIAMKKKA